MTKYSKRKAAGLCSRCNELVVPGKALCETHLAKECLRQKALRHKKRSLGLCVWGGCKSQAQGKSYCKYHLLELRRLQPEKYRCGLSVEQYGEMYKKQEGRCGICQQKFDALNVDHDHTTSEIRGLLCFQCNAGLGLFKDNEAYLLGAVSYLHQNTRK